MIIAISGKKFSGKSTVAKMLGEELGWEVTAFAKKLKEITCILSGCTMEQLEDYNFKENAFVPHYLWAFCNGNKKPTYRNFLQSFGSDFMRKQHSGIWAFSTLENAPNDLIISDCRFTNEQRIVSDLNGIIIKVLSPRGYSNDLHCSEVEMDYIEPDVIINNDCSLEELRSKVKMLANDIVNCTIKAEY